MVKCSIRFLIVPVMMFSGLMLYAQEKKITPSEYISRYQHLAIQEMQLYKIPASITMGQGMLESDCGNSILAVNSNNHFGIKCKAEWTGEKYYHDDDEKQECFRKYSSIPDSYRDHSLFLTTRSWYASLFLLDITDYAGWARGLKQAGYATDPKYAEKLIRIIEENRLYELDRGKVFDFSPVTTDSVKVEIAKEPIDSTAKHVTDDALDFADTFSPENSRRIGTVNGVRFILAHSNDTYAAIAGDFGLSATDIAGYNDTCKEYVPRSGEIVFIESKKGKAEVEFHVVANGETMHGLSQKYGMKLRSLYRKNRMKRGTEAAPGTKLWLQQKVPAY